MSKKISTVGYEIPGQDDLKLEFSSNMSLMDSDILLFSPDLPFYETQGDYLGKPRYNENGSFKLKKDIAHWKEELISFLNSGKTVFFMLSKKYDFYIDTGERTYSGSGKNITTSIKVTEANNYELLPTQIGTIHAVAGKEIRTTGNPLFNSFFSTFKPNLEYRAYIENPTGTPIFTGRDKAKILGALCKVGAGHLVILPYLHYEEIIFIEYKGEHAYWNEEAVEFGHKLINCLIDIDKGLLQDSCKTPAPLWVSHEEYLSKKEITLKAALNRNIKKIKKIQEKNETLKSQIKEEHMLKDLLYEQGKPLENAVIKALEILGYTAENYNDGELELDQVITSPEGYRYIGECEGKNEKDIDIIKFRQLLESLNADFARDSIEEKAFGILFGNPQRLTEPKDRTLDFTQKCKTGAQREGIALIRTTDLFEIANFLKEKKDKHFQKKCRLALHNGLGSIIKFPNLPKNNDNDCS